MEPIILLLYIFLGVLVTIAIVSIITFLVSLYETKCLKNHSYGAIFLGKLCCNEVDNFEDFTKYLELTNSIKDGIL